MPDRTHPDATTLVIGPAKECEVHKWPSKGLAARLVRAMRATHPRGVDACRACIERARKDAERSQS